MHIYSKSAGPMGPEFPRTTPTSNQVQLASASEPRGGSSARGTDKVEISDAGRALVAQGGSQSSGELDQVRAARIHAQVISGAYDSLDVVDTVARRLINSGDL